MDNFTHDDDEFAQENNMSAFENENAENEAATDASVNDDVNALDDLNNNNDIFQSSIFGVDPIADDEAIAGKENVETTEDEDPFSDVPPYEPQQQYQYTPPQPPQQQYTPPQPSQYQQPPRQQYQPPQQQYQPYNFGRQSQPPQPTPAPKKGKGAKVFLIIIIIVAFLAASGFAGKVIARKISSNAGKVTSETTAPTDAQGNSEQTTQADSPVKYAQTSDGNALSAVEVADKVRPSVVGVMVYQNGEAAGEGSGVVMGVDSTNTYTYIITCAHVISENNVTYGVLTLDGTSYTAELVGYDTRTDIGVLKVKDTSFTAAEFGDSTQMKIGQTVYAIGNPGGSEYFGSMTRGIVSAIDRTVTGTYNLTCIQHDAAINPGNSGGALLNEAGQVVGINSSKIAATDYEGMGFAVPTSTAVSIAENLIKFGYVPNRPKLGITYASVSNYQVYSMVVAIKGLPAGSLIITDISEDSALAGTDAKKGDMIIAVNGKNMDTSAALLDLIDKGAVGDSLTLTLCRVDQRTYQTTTFDVTIKLVEDKGNSAEKTTSEESIYNFDENGGSNGNDRYGDFSDFFRQYFGF